MRHFLTFAALAMVTLSAYATTPTDVVADFHRALSNGDAAHASALLSPSVEIYESGYVERSRAEYASHHLVSDIQYAKATTSRVLRQSERIGGDLAVVMRETETRGTFRGREVNQIGTETVLLEKAGDGWIIAHVHWSSRKGK